jgi:uncharacterized protein YecE (DUF72 family)
MLPLFDPPSSFDTKALSQKLRALCADGIWIGGSSWKYEGWMDQIYTRQRYTTRGRFSKKRFEAECLAEYAETFPIVCGDFSFYQFPTPQFWLKLFGSASPELRMALKVPEEITGTKTESYLNAEMLKALFLEPLEPHLARIPVLIFEFGARSASAREFVDGLDPFLAQLPTTFRYAIEVRNRDYLQPRYFDCLRAHGVAHVLNAWARMPLLSEQMALPGVFPADFTVVRALLRQGRPYEEAVKRFQPYDKIQDENPEARDSLRALIKRMREERRAAYIFVNNRLEGNSPETIRAVVSE